MTCSVCHVDPAVALDRCSTCYRYRIRTGKDRSRAQIERWLRRRAERHQVGRLLQEALSATG